MVGTVEIKNELHRKTLLKMVTAEINKARSEGATIVRLTVLFELDSLLRGIK